MVVGFQAMAFDFEAGTKGWRNTTWGGRAEFDYVRAGRGGGMCLQVSSTAGADAAWHIRAPVIPYSKYLLTGWIKTRSVAPTNGVGALLNLHAREEKSDFLSGSTDWKQVRLEFDSG